MAININDIIRKFENLSTHRQYYEPRWAELAKFISPNRKDVQYQSIPGSKKTDDLFDSTAINARALLVATLAGSITSPSRKWFNLKTGSPSLNEFMEVLEWLEELKRITFYYYNQSNLYRELNIVYDELTSLGTGALLIEANPPNQDGSFGGLNFKSMALKEVYFAESKEGIADTLFRKFQMTAMEAAQTWGVNSLPDKMRKTYDTKPFDYVTILHGVYPRDIPRNEKDVLRLGVNKDYASVYISYEEKQLIYEGGFDLFPFAVPRWMKYAGEVYGRGPADEALPDIKTLNRVEEMGLKWGALRMQPPFAIEDKSIMGKFVLEPRSMITVRGGRSAKDAISPLELGGDLNLQMIMVQDKRDQIKKAFYADQIEAFVAIDAPRRTATEVQLRYDLMQNLLGPILTNIEQELLNPLVSKTIEILARNGAFPPPPDVLLYDAEAGDIDVEYETPLAKRQKVDEAMALQSVYEMISLISPLAPDVGDGIDHDKVLRTFGKIRGAPTYIFRSDEDLKAIRQGKDGMEQQNQQAEEALALTQGLKNIAPFAKLLQAREGAATGSGL